MNIRVFRPARRLVAVSFLCVSALASTAQAQVTEPNGKAVPVLTGAAEQGVVTGRGFPADAVTLPGLFTYRGETINYQTDAHTKPGAFSPLCGFTGEMVLRGGGCQLDFGWYNTTDPPTSTPSASDLHVLIPKTAYTDPNGYACMPTMPGDFCPLATHQTSQTQNTWVDKVYDASSIRNDPAYKGGLIGFAIFGWQSDGMANHNCTEIHYSQQEINPTTDLSAGQHWIASLTWQSTRDPNSYYIGFEDWPMSAANWSSGANDGDFNDFVFYLTGLTCKGGGQPCTIPDKQGACAAGKYDCDTGGTLVCRSSYTPEPEKCNNVDDDCNGQVDDGDGVLDCGAGKFCHQGRCVGSCESGEFPCPAPLVCQDNRCVDAACEGVTCPTGQVCELGNCIDACANVTCPIGQQCVLGRCIDPCNIVQADGSLAPVKCTQPNQVCEQGVCIANCSCRGCPDGKVCGASGVCVDPGCENKQCAAGQVCSMGTCVDACQGAVCPGGAECMNGQCGEPKPGVVNGGSTSGGGGGASTGTTGTPVIISTGGGSGGSAGVGGTNAGSTTSGIDQTASGGGPRAKAAQNGCQCTLVGGRRSLSSRYGAALGALLGLSLLRLGRQTRRRRSRRGPVGR